MNILILSEYHHKKFNDRIMLGFLSRLKKYYNINIYGSIVGEDKYKDFRLLNFNNDITIEDVEKEYKADLILYNCISHPNGYGDIFRNFKHKTPLIIIHGDYYSFDKSLSHDYGLNMFNFYKESKVELVISSNYISWDYPIDYIFLPRSANEEEFFDNSEDRENTVGFAGSVRNKFPYKTRYKALYTLNEAGLLSNYGIGIFKDKKYIDYLLKHKAMLSCSGDLLHTSLAKTFEIMLSGTALLSPWIYNEDKLFDNKQCFFKYKNDCSDIVEVAKQVLSDDGLVEEVTSNAIEVIKKYHTHEKRIEDYKEVIDAFYYGKEIPKKWS